jgi:hypothetical protein
LMRSAAAATSCALTGRLAGSIVFIGNLERWRWRAFCSRAAERGPHP